MRRLRSRTSAGLVLLGCTVASVLAACLAPTWGKNALLHPWRRSAPPAPAIPHEEVELLGDGVVLRGWRFPAHGVRRGLVVYLHGIGDDRRGGEGIARRFTPLGFEVIAYDSRAHGKSGGEACTYGVAEKRDLARVLDGQRTGPVAVIGGSLGGAVALQAAAEDPRISLVVAIAPFSDLRTVAGERAPFFVSRGQVAEALRLAEMEGGFSVDEASPLAAAPRIRCPVLLLHGASDRSTPPRHSERIFAALECERELLLLPGVGHDDPIGAEPWERIELAVRSIAADR